MIKSIKWKNATVEVSYEIEWGCEGSTDSYGLKNEPDTSNSLYIDSITYNNIDVVNLFDTDDLLQIEEILWEQLDE